MAIITSAEQGPSTNPIQGTSPLKQVAPPIETAPPAEKTDDPMSPKLLELARRTKAQRQAQLKFQQEQQAFESKRAELERKESEYQKNFVPRDRIKTDLLGVLSEAGISAPELIKILQGQGGQAISQDLESRRLRQEFEEFKATTQAEREQSTKQYEQNVTEQYQQAINQIRFDTKALVERDSSFEMIKAERAEESVVQFIELVYKEGLTDEDGKEIYPKGKALTVDEAAQKVEDYLTTEALRLAQLPKVQKKLAPQEIEMAAAPKQQQITPKQSQIKTLTNSMTASTSKSLSAAERRARAIAVAEGRIPAN